MGSNSLTERDFYGDLNDSIILTNPGEDTEFIHDLSDLKNSIDQLLESGPIAYVTGGFEGTLAHINLIKNLNMPVILGLESDSYIRDKGREPLVLLEERISNWLYLCPDHSRIFVIENNNNDPDYYENLAKEIGVFQRENVYHIGNENDSDDIKIARKKRCFSLKYYQEINYGKNLHTSNYK